MRHTFTLVINMEKLYFHEATIEAVSQNGEIVQFSIEGVHTDNGEVCNVQVTFNGVHEILRDGCEVDSLFMEMDDGEVLSLELNSGRANLVVEWNNFVDRQSDVKAYQFNYSTVTASSPH
ncbi:hypothetical protein KSF73_16670 [Burkholderiaceae bacterium DAT-1]|nr:hypothetical protein [Burkholderiaceae bacterium DAT-1]